MNLSASRKDTIRRLMEEVRTLEASGKNAARRQKWECLPYTARDQWRGLPKTDGSCLSGNIPLQVDPNNVFWSQYLGFNIRDYFLDPATYVESYLKMTIGRFKLFDDDVFIAKRFPLWMGAPYEGSMFGMEVGFFADVDPWLDYTTLQIREREDLDKMEPPDFYKSGLMPRAIDMFEGVKELVDDDFDVLFPEFLRGPFGLATYIRGFENLLMDMIDEPEFVHRLMRYLNDSRKSWYRELEKYLGRPVIKGNIFNDEVNTPSLSESLYEEFVLPYEQEICEMHGGLHYYHSCGNLSKLYPLIERIAPIDMVHKSPWSTPESVAKAFGQRGAIEVCLDPQADICEKDESQMFDLVYKIIRELVAQKVKGFTIRANNIQKYDSFENSIHKVNMFLNASRRAIEKAIV